MDNLERPEKRRKVDGEKGDGAIGSQSPRVVLNKITVDQSLLERFRKIRNITKQKLNPKLDNNESEETSAQDSNQNGCEADNATKVSINTLKSKVNDNKSSEQDTNLRMNELHKVNESIRQSENDLFTPSKCQNETVEGLDKTERLIQKSGVLNETRSKRKRDENCNENPLVDKIPKFKQENLASTSRIQAEQEGDQNEKQCSLDSPDNDGLLERTSPTDDLILNKAFPETKEKKNISNDDEAIECTHHDVQVKVEVTKVAQNYAKSGAQTEKNNDVATDNQPDGPNNVEDTLANHSEEVLVYQLLKDVIEKQTSAFANSIIQDNDKLEKRVEHLERENELLKKTSKRLHLALQAVFKNREKNRQSQCSRGVQVNLSLDRSSFRNTSHVNSNIAEYGKRSEEVREFTGSESVSNPQTLSMSKLQRQKSPSCGIMDHSLSNLENMQGKKKNDSSDGSPNAAAVVSMSAQEKYQAKTYSEGMGHFKLHSRHRYRGQPLHKDSSETAHYKMTPHGLELQSYVRNSEERIESRDASTSPIRTELNTENAKQHLEKTKRRQQDTVISDVPVCDSQTALQKPPSQSPIAKDIENIETPSTITSIHPSMSLSHKPGSSFNVEAEEPDLIIVSPREESRVEGGTPSVQHKDMSIGKPQNDIKSLTNIVSTKEHEPNDKDQKKREMINNNERLLGERELIKLKNQTYVNKHPQDGIHSERNIDELLTSRTTAKSLNSYIRNSPEVHHSADGHLDKRCTNAVTRVRDNQPILDQRQDRENSPCSYSQQLVSSRPQRFQEQYVPYRSVADQAMHQGDPQEGRLQRPPDARSHHHQPHPSQQHQHPMKQQQQGLQQHLIIKQPYPQQITGYHQTRTVNPPPYPHQRTPTPHANVHRAAPPSYQSPYQIQQAQPRPVRFPPRSDASMPLSPELVNTAVPKGTFNEAPRSKPPQLIPGNLQQTRQGPVVVYQPGTLEGTIRPGMPRFPDNLRQNPTQGEVVQIRQRSNTVEQNISRSAQNQMTPPVPPYEVPRGDKRPTQDYHINSVTNQRCPPKPSASIAIVENGIVLSWNVSPENDTSDIDSYELFACQDDTNSNAPPVLWKKIGVVKALPLPMACTLTQFTTGSRYQFAVRAVDSAERAGPFSDPCLITLKKS